MNKKKQSYDFRRASTTVSLSDFIVPKQQPAPRRHRWEKRPSLLRQPANARHVWNVDAPAFCSAAEPPAAQMMDLTPPAIEYWVEPQQPQEMARPPPPFENLGYFPIMPQVPPPPPPPAMAPPPPPAMAPLWYPLERQAHAHAPPPPILGYFPIVAPQPQPQPPRPLRDDMVWTAPLRLNRPPPPLPHRPVVAHIRDNLLRNPAPRVEIWMALPPPRQEEPKTWFYWLASKVKRVGRQISFVANNTAWYLKQLFSSSFNCLVRLGL
eukprot:Platyproteum_vivax@DN10141_c0_g1_i1.p1